MNWNVKTILGDDDEPNEVWLRWGQIGGILAMIGLVTSATQFQGFGVKIQPMTIAAQGTCWIILLISILIAKYATDLKKNKHIALQKHQKELASLSAPKIEPHDRHHAFVKECLPATREQLALEKEFSHYTPLSPEDKHSILMQATANECVGAGLAKVEEGTYTPIKTDATVTG